MKHRTLALFVGIGLVLGTFTSIGASGRASGEASSPEEQTERKELKREGVKQNKGKPEKPRDSKAGSDKKDEINSRGLGNMGPGQVERRPGGCPEGPPCKGLP